jgi:hypothetical protein
VEEYVGITVVIFVMVALMVIRSSRMDSQYNLMQIASFQKTLTTSQMKKLLDEKQWLMYVDES